MADDFVPSAPALSGGFTDDNGQLEDKDIPYNERERSVALWYKEKQGGKPYLTGKLGTSGKRLTLWACKGWKIVKDDSTEEPEW